MRALGLILIWTAACSVSPELSALPCPCAPGFRCVADRCVAGEGDDVGVADAGGADSSADASRDSGVGSDDASVDVGEDAPVDDLIFEIVEDEGTGANIDWFGENLEIESVPGTGTLESRVFDAGRSVNWRRFEWVPTRPYGRAVDGSAEPSYEDGELELSGLRLIMPFDAPLGPRDPGSTYRDLSDGARIGRVVGDGASSVPGVFAEAFAATDTSWTALSMSGNLFPATSDHTLAFWARSTQSCQNDVRVFIGSEGSGADKSHVWIGCWDGGSCQQGSVGGVWVSDETSASTTFICSTQDANDGEWHHIAVRKVGHDSASVEIWFDGEVISDTDAVYSDTTFRFDEGEDLWFGHFFNGGYPTTVDLDEALFFSRALDASEIEELYLRGSLNARFEIRTCETPDCSDGVYTSLEGEAGTSGDAPPSSALPLARDLDFTGRYAQVRISMTSTDSSNTPEISGMRLFAE